MTRFEEQSREYREILDEVYDLFMRKGLDYGKSHGENTDHYSNLRRSERIGIPAWQGAFIRLNDKIGRVETFILNGKLENESLDDSFWDIAVYALNIIALRREDDMKKVAETYVEMANAQDNKK